MMKDCKLVGFINFARLENVGIMDIKGKSATKKCVVIPVDDNDIFIKIDEKVNEQTGEIYIQRLFNLGIEILEKREPDQWGNVCYAKLSTSKEWINAHTPQQLEVRNRIYLGNFKSVTIQSSNQATTMDSPTVEVGEKDEVPF